MNIFDVEEKNKLKVQPSDINFGLAQPVKPISLKSPYKAGNPEDSVMTGGLFSPQVNSRPDRIGTGTRVVERNMLSSINNNQLINTNVPKLKELPNAQRDSELGKMNVGTDGNIVTYDIGGNTLSYDASKTDPSKINLRNINRASSNASGNATTWDDYHRQQKERYNAYMESPRGRYFGATPIDTETPKDNSLGGLFVQGLQNRKALADAKMESEIAGQDINRAELGTQAERNRLMADANRISELDVQGQNRLRDIQGQVAQEPPIKESALKPMVIDEPDPNDPTGMSKRQRIMIPNAEGTGYVDGMSGQAPTSTVPQVTPEQRSKINALIKANPNIDRATILQKIANGEI